MCTFGAQLWILYDKATVLLKVKSKHYKYVVLAILANTKSFDGFIFNVVFSPMVAGEIDIKM